MEEGPRGYEERCEGQVRGFGEWSSRERWRERKGGY